MKAKSGNETPPKGGIDDNRLAEVFANHADHTPYLNFDAFKEAVKELFSPVVTGQTNGTRDE